METSTFTPDIQNPELIKLPLALRVGKWLFWLTIFFYTTYIGITYYLYWKYPEGVSKTIVSNMEILNVWKIVSWILTLISIVFWIWQLLRNKSLIHRGKMIITLGIILFTIFWYQWLTIKQNLLLEGKSDICKVFTCGRPYRPRKLFSWFSKEAEVVKWKNWNTIR